MDRHHETSKDAIDLLTLLRLYSDAGNEDRLYGEETDLLESSAFDPVVAGARLLGRDAVALCGKLTSRALLERLTNPLRQDLENHLLRGTARIDDDASQARTLALLAAYLDELAKASATQ